MAAKAGPDAQVPRQRKGGESGESGDLGGRRPRRLRAAGRRAGTGPYAARARGRGDGRRRRRGRYILWTTLSLVVVGIGTASFGMGGGSTGPKVTPQLEVFDAQHAVTSGDVPFADAGRAFRARSGASGEAVMRPGLLMTAVATVTVPGLLAMVGVIGHDHVAGQAPRRRGATAPSGPFPVAPSPRAPLRDNGGLQRRQAPVTVLSRVTVGQQAMGCACLPWRRTPT